MEVGDYVEVMQNHEGFNIQYLIGKLVKPADAYSTTIKLPEFFSKRFGVPVNLIIQTQKLSELGKEFKPKYIIYFRDEPILAHYDKDKIITILNGYKIDLKDVRILNISSELKFKEEISIEEVK